MGTFEYPKLGAIVKNFCEWKDQWGDGFCLRRVWRSEEVSSEGLMMLLMSCQHELFSCPQELRGLVTRYKERSVSRDEY
jgi:hypothetical protein